MADYKSNPTTSKSTEEKRSSINLLPEYLQTDTNKKFLNATLDQMIAKGTPVIKSGYIGKNNSIIRSATDDVYLRSKTTLNNRYQLDPTVISQNVSTLEYESAIPYDDIVSNISIRKIQW